MKRWSLLTYMADPGGGVQISPPRSTYTRTGWMLAMQWPRIPQTETGAAVLGAPVYKSSRTLQAWILTRKTIDTTALVEAGAWS